jgi:hypothetical protein
MVTSGMMEEWNDGMMDEWNDGRMEISFLSKSMVKFYEFIRIA